MPRIPLYLIALLASIATHAQLKTQRIVATDQVTHVSVDRLGNFYVVLASNHIQKYDCNGALLREIPFPTTHLSLIEAWNPLRIFIYTENDQRYTLLGPHLNVLESQPFNLPLHKPPKQVCPANNNNQVWVFDSSAPSINKVNINSLNTSITIPIPNIGNEQQHTITFLREYQDELFVLDKATGIHIFSHIGIPIANIPTVGLANFNFIGEELCYLNEGNVFLYDLYTGEERIWQDISHISDIQFVLGTDERVVVVADHKIHFLDTPP